MYNPSNNERALYEVLLRRRRVPDLSYSEYAEAAREVVAEIPEEAITPIEEMLDRLEERILTRRKTWGQLNIFLGPKK